MAMKICIVLGTRPEIVKLAPVIRALEKKNIPFFIVHSGQHYTASMDTVFFRDLNLPEPKYNLEIGTLAFRHRVATMVRKLHAILENEWPDVVVVQGDTFTVSQAALTAKRLDRPVAHIEAGLRSHDLSMPEETNRILVDHIAEFLYPPTMDAAKNLFEEGITSERLPVLGNTAVDSVLQNIAISERAGDICAKYGVQKKHYVLVTAHRQENVDHESRLRGIIEGVLRVQREHPELDILFPIHPRTEKMLEKFGIHKPASIRFIEPVPYLEMLQLTNGASLLITDSGGLQEEATVLHVPCVTIRDNTERPESIEAGMNVLAGADADRIATSAHAMLTKEITWRAIYGDGTAGEKTVEDLIARLKIRKGFVARARWVLRSARRAVLGGRRAGKKR